MNAARIAELRKLCETAEHSPTYFTEHARTALPEALDCIERLRAALQRIAKREYECGHCGVGNYPMDASEIAHEALGIKDKCAKEMESGG